MHTGSALTVRDVARHLGVSVSTVRRLMRTKALKSHKIHNRRYVYAHDLLAFEHGKPQNDQQPLLSFFKWFTVTTGILSMVFLFLATIPERTAPVYYAYDSFSSQSLTLQDIVLAHNNNMPVTGMEFFSLPEGEINIMEYDPKTTKEDPGAYVEGYYGEPGPVAVITDSTTLTHIPFFQQVRNGDKLFIYQKTAKAVLFRPMTNQVIAFGFLE